MYPERKARGRAASPGRKLTVGVWAGVRAGVVLGAALSFGACSGSGDKTDGGNNGSGGEGNGPPGGEGPSAGVVSKKGRLKFRDGNRLASDLAVALGLPREEVCRELGAYDCVTVHNVVLGGVEPYNSSVYEPLPKRAVPTALAVDRVALSACDRRATLDFGNPAAAVVFAELAADPQMGDAAIEATAATLYSKLLRRDARPDEARALVDFGRELRGELGAEAPRRFATLGCFAVATTAEALFYLARENRGKTPMATNTSRRNVLRALAGGAAAAGALGAFGAFNPRRGRAAAPPPRFLIVLAANGGASLIDGPLAIRASEAAAPETLNCYPDAAVTGVEGVPFRALASQHTSLGPIPYKFAADQAPFVKKHGRDMMVATLQSTSVNHGIAQRRAVTGNEAWAGRTLQEAVALQYGGDALLPNVHLTTGTGFTELGGDDSLPARCFGEPVAEPKLWPLSLHGSRGTAAGDRPDLVARARALREGKLEPASPFGGVFRNSAALKQWAAARGPEREGVEAADLISRLMLFPESPGLPLAAHGLGSSPDADAVRARFPNYATDPLDAQAALAFLLLKYRISVTVTLGPSGQFVFDGDPGGGIKGNVYNPPIAFDFSHQGHRATQGFMWDRIYRVADGLIELLKAEEFGDGQSMWDRTAIYVATDFGRSKNRPANAPEFGTAHDLNNGVVLLSPLVKGGTLLGGVDATTGLTYGFDPETGTPDQNRRTSEREIYSGILHALGVDTAGSGLPDMRAMRKTA